MGASNSQILLRWAIRNFLLSPFSMVGYFLSIVDQKGIKSPITTLWVPPASLKTMLQIPFQIWLIPSERSNGQPKSSFFNLSEWSSWLIIFHFRVKMRNPTLSASSAVSKGISLPAVLTSPSKVLFFILSFTSLLPPAFSTISSPWASSSNPWIFTLTVFSILWSSWRSAKL